MGLMQMLGMGTHMLEGAVVRIGYVHPVTTNGEQSEGQYVLQMAGERRPYLVSSSDLNIKSQLALINSGDEIAVTFRGNINGLLTGRVTILDCTNLTLRKLSNEPELKAVTS